MVYRHGVGLCALAADTPMKPARINAAEIYTVFLLNILLVFFPGFPFRLPLDWACASLQNEIKLFLVFVGHSELLERQDNCAATSRWRNCANEAAKSEP